MATFNKFYAFVEHLAEGKHNLESNQLSIALSASENQPSGSSASGLADITQVAYTFCSSRDITAACSLRSSGSYILTLTDLTLTATGGAIGPLQYVTLYNSSCTACPLIGYYDYGNSITLNSGETLNINFSAGSGVLTLV